MPIFVILILMSFSFYLFYKIQYVRTKNGTEKKWLSAKSSIALGTFVALFGINRLFLGITPLSLAVSLIFMAVGIASCLSGLRAYQYYSPYVEREGKN